MKFKLIISILYLFLLSSCVSTKINKNNQDYSILKENKYYIVKTKDRQTYRHFKFSQENNEEIIGFYKNKEFQISKSEIKKINKLSFVNTVVAVVFPIAVIATATAIVSDRLQMK
ncbi:MAG: hypothetical protein JST62_09520 [Bacteroidetes bacterium]|nr:hypothetical protein [Bacteroidota bacterium]